MRRVYKPYWDWEDYKSGMWDKSLNEDYDLERCVEFTSNHVIYGNAMREVIIKWKNTMLHNLTNPSLNRKAFLGHCAVTYKIGVPEYLTRKAWKLLTEKQRILANIEADKTIKSWMLNKEYLNTLKNGNQDVTQKVFQMKFLFQ